jgi:hypothetical protein
MGKRRIRLAYRFIADRTGVEQGAEDPRLSKQILSGDPEDLPLANDLHCFDPFNHRIVSGIGGASLPIARTAWDEHWI